MMEVNLSNMLFGGFVIEAIDFPPTATKRCSKRYAQRQLTHVQTHKHTHTVNVEFNLLMNLSWWHLSLIWQRMKQHSPPTGRGQVIRL